MPTPKKRYLDSTPAVTKQQLAKMNRQSNARERNIAKAYLEAGPNIVNLAKAAYHWYNSVPWLGGKDENGNILVTKEVPIPGMRSPKSIVKGVRTITSPKGIAKGVRAITKANAHKITPKQWTAAQDAAIAKGDMAEAQRLRDLHFMAKAPNTFASINRKPLQLYHGTNSNFNAFDLSRYGSTDGGTFGRGVYTTPIQEYAQLYGKNNMPLYMKLDNPRDYRNYSIRDLIAEKLAFGEDFATGNGIDGVIGRPSWKGFKGLEEYVSHNPRNIKSSKAVTYDDNGVRIPLGERDNFKLNDIRYGLIPITGGIGYGLYKKSNKNKNIR